MNLAREYSINPIHMSLSFCKQRPFMGSVIFGATNIKQLRLIIEGLNVVLSSEIMEKINLINNIQFCKFQHY